MRDVDSVSCWWKATPAPFGWLLLGILWIIGCQTPVGEATKTRQISVETMAELPVDLPKKIIYYQKENKIECWAGTQALPIAAIPNININSIPIGIYQLSGQQISLPERDFVQKKEEMQELLQRLENIQRHFLIVDTLACYPLDELLVYPNDPANAGLQPSFASKPWLAEIYGALHAYYQNHNAGM